jgi:hypothetical protein
VAISAQKNTGGERGNQVKRYLGEQKDSLSG